MSPSANVIWHDLECGAYREDLALWRELAARAGGTVADLGAGTGRVSLDLAAAGHDVIAVDLDAELLGELGARAAASGVTVRTVLADVREFALPEAVGLCLVPMQTVQLLRGGAERRAMLRCVREALAPSGRLAIAIADELEPFEVRDGGPAPLPDIGEFDGTVYSSRPLAIRPLEDAFVLERRREIVSPGGELESVPDLVRLAALAPERLEAEGVDCGFRVAARGRVATTAEYVGSTVVMLDA